jgi:hypothetical protein
VKLKKEPEIGWEELEINTYIGQLVAVMGNKYKS